MQSPGLTSVDALVMRRGADSHSSRHLSVMHTIPVNKRHGYGLAICCAKLRGNRGIALESHGRPEECDRNGCRVENAKQPPNPGARSVLVHRLHGEVPLIVDGEGQFVHAVVDLIAHRKGLLRPFLVVHDDLHRHLGAVGPTYSREVLAVADQLAGRAWYAGETTRAINDRP
jgi:hypothetical protein